MCTTNLIHVPLTGTVAGDAGAVRISQGVVTCDHPATLSCDHAVLLDLWDTDGPRRTRVSLELEPRAAAALAEAILSALRQAQAELHDGAASGWENTSDLTVTGTVRDGRRNRPRST